MAGPLDLKGNNLGDAAASSGCLFGERERFILTAKPVKGLSTQNSEAAGVGCEGYDDVVADLDIHGRSAARL